MQANAQMLTLGRELRAITQSQLAKQLSVTQGKLSKMESGLLAISDEDLGKISRVLQLPVHFFEQTDQIYGPDIGEIFHRKKQSISQKSLQKIYAQINIRTIQLKRLLQSVEIPESKFHPYDPEEFDGQVESIAKLIRCNWLIPRGPIQNLTQIIENAGGVVFSCDFGTRLVDAISRWVPGLPPMFFVNKEIPTDRYRFSLSHELAHIFLHRTLNSEMEKQADRFAAEFLMPSDQIRLDLKNISLERLAELKNHWKTSMGAILKRADDLGVITDRQARYLWMKMSKLGLRSMEPPLRQEHNESGTIIKELLDVHRNELDYSFEELSHLFALPIQEIPSWYPSLEIPQPQNRLFIVR